MIAYLDTSALLKLYLTESDSRRVHQAVADAEVVYTNLITYAEIRAALAQAGGMKRLSATECAEQVSAFEADWTALEVIAVDEPLVRRAGEHARRHDLRGYDSVHLAAAERVFITIGADAFLFLGFDARLNRAAAAVGIPLPGTAD